MPQPADPHAPTLHGPPETIHVTESPAACDGGGGALGHPRVFLRIVGRQVICPYCSRLFILDGESHGHDH